MEMSFIQCAKPCVYQSDGYCGMDVIGKITNTEGGCPHYISKDSKDSLPEISHGEKLDTEA